MHDVFDRLENRSAASRESALFRDLQHVLAVSKSRAPALRQQLKGIAIDALRSRADLAIVPLRRPSDIAAAQRDEPPFGGYVATRPAALSRVFVAADGMATPAGQARDWWGLGRGFYAAGLRKGMLVLNGFSYDLVPDGHMADAGAQAIGCAVLPAGSAPSAAIVAAVLRYRPRFFCGPVERLRAILDAGVEAGADLSCLAFAFTAGTLKPGPRQEIALRGLALRHALVLPELGLIGYESGDDGAMTLAEHLLLELLDPATGTPVEPGDVGEMVVTRINPDYPLLRFATGQFARAVPKPSGCGRTNARFAPAPDPRANGEARPIHEIRARHPDLRMRLTFHAGTPHLEVEHGDDEPALRAHLVETLTSVVRGPGTVAIVHPGTLPDDEGTGGPIAP